VRDTNNKCVILFIIIASDLNVNIFTSVFSTLFVLFFFQRDRKLIIANREISLPQQFAIVGLCSIPVFLLAGAGAYCQEFVTLTVPINSKNLILTENRMVFGDLPKPKIMPFSQFCLLC
jgi:hypothetical protein